MSEIEWFISILNTNEMKMVGRHIPGFPPDLVAPGKLREKLESAFVLGYKKQTTRRYKQAAINIRELYTKVGTEFLTRNPHLKENSLSATVIKLRGLSRLRPLNAVGILHMLFPDEFELILPKMIENTVNKIEFLEGVGVSEKINDLEKVAILMGIRHFANVKLLKNTLKVFSLVIAQGRPISDVGTEEELVEALHKADVRDRLSLLIQFLLKQADWERKEIRPLIDFAMTEYYKHSAEKAVELASHENYQTVHSHKLEQRLWEEEKLSLNQQLEALKSKVIMLEKQMVVLVKEKQDVVKEFETGKERWASDIFPMKQWLYLMSEMVQEPVLFISDDPQYLLAKLLNYEVVSKDKLFAIGKTRWKSLSNHLFFVVRYSIGTSQEWNQLKALFEMNQVTYYELIGYSEMDHMIQFLTNTIHYKEEKNNDESSYEFINY